MTQNRLDDYEREIDLRLLCGYLLRNIKNIAVITLIIGIVAFLGLTVKALKSESKAADVADTTVEDIKLTEEIDAEKIASVEATIEELNLQYNDEKEYIDNSYYISMNESNVYQETIVISAIATENQTANVTLSVARNVLGSGEVYEDLQKALSIKGNRKLQYTSEIYGRGLDTVAETLTVTLFAKDDIDLSAMDEIVTEAINKADKDTEAEIVIQSKEKINGFNSGVYDAKKNHRNALKTLSDQMLAKKAELKSLNDAAEKTKEDNEKALAAAEEALKENTESADVLSKLRAVGVKGLVKNIIIGVIAGLFVSAGVYAALYVLSDTIRSEEELTNAYGIRYLGTTCVDRNLKPIKGVKWNKFIEWVEGKDNTLSKDDSTELLALNIERNSEKAKKIGVVSTLGIEESGVVEAVKVLSEKAGKEILLLDFSKKVVSATNELLTCDQVIVVESVNKSKNNSVIKELKMINENGTELMGIAYV